MTNGPLEHLSAAAAALRAAMEQGRTDGIVDALVAFSAAVDAVKAIGAWQPDGETRTLLSDIAARLDADRNLALLLGDLAGQQRERIASAAPGAATATYRRAN